MIEPACVSVHAVLVDHPKPKEKILVMGCGTIGLGEMFESGKKPSVIVEEKGLKQIDNDDELMAVVQKVIADQPQSVADFKAGKERALKALMGGVMKETKGKANPEKVQEMMLAELNK